jgi:tetratricopeptide (TPR) repeat protein
MTAERERQLLYGQSLQQAGRLDEAKAQYRRLVANDPGDPLAMHYLGMAEHQSGESRAGLQRVNGSLLLWPQHAAFYANRATIALEVSDATAAFADCYLALCLQPDLAEACLHAGQALGRLRRFDVAVAWARRAVEFQPINLPARLELAKVVYESAIGTDSSDSETFRGYYELLIIAPDFAECLSDLGRGLLRRGRNEEGLNILGWALRVQPDHARALSNSGIALLESGHPSEALAAFSKGYTLLPTLSDAAANAGLALLLLGRYAEGWALYEARLRTKSFWSEIANSTVYFFGQRQIFPGFGFVSGKRVLVWAEQGVGDEVMFGGLLGEFSELCPKVMVQVDPRLKNLFERSFPGVKVYSRGERVAAERYDYQLFMGSLGKWLRPTRESFEGKGGRYLKAQEGLGRRLRADLGVGASEKLIGLSWRSASAETGAARSLSLKALVGALQGVEGVRFLNLQYGEVSEELRALREETGVEVLTHPGIDNREDLEGLAGLIEGCDLVVSVGNATAHLSGALGQKTWVLLPYVAGWRWLHEGERCPWYQSVRLFRQAERGQWGSVLAVISGMKF